MYLPCICPTIVPPINWPKTIRKALHLCKCLFQGPMNPSCKELTRKLGVIYTHLCMYFSTCWIQNFFLKVNHFIFKSSSYLELVKVIAPFKPVHICLMKSVDPVVYKLKKVVAPLRFAPAMLQNKLCHVPYGACLKRKIKQESKNSIQGKDHSAPVRKERAM